jgi:hypothetical protein
MWIINLERARLGPGFFNDESLGERKQGELIDQPAWARIPGRGFREFSIHRRRGQK